MNFTFGLPREFVLVGEDGGGDGGAVVAAPSHQHETHLWNLPLCSERHRGRAGGSLETYITYVNYLIFRIFFKNEIVFRMRFESDSINFFTVILAPSTETSVASYL